MTAVEILVELRDSLPPDHPERPGVIRAIEVLRVESYEGKPPRPRNGPGLRGGTPGREARAMTVCPTCHGSGLVWRGTSSARRGRLNEDHEPCMAAFRCPTCPDDGTGNSVGTGRIEG